ncbi:MAG: D-2-hydroxyacid dehydrogenase family protein [Proteobacteria bacterium]|nr:D-2-hydroxyacid dehydrogenase family protein [Pseudomonadota bacterium]
MKIVIPDDYQDAARQMSSFSRLAAHEVKIYNDTVKSLPEQVERFSGAQALLLIRERTRISDELLSRLPELRLISQTGQAASHIDLAACTRRGIVVSAAGSGTLATAEFAWAMIMAARRHIPIEAQRLKQGRWQTTLGTVLKGRTIGIYGYGRIGQQVARFADAFGMKVVTGGGREATAQRAAKDGRVYLAERERFFEMCDVISVHLRLTDATRGLITDADLKRMKPDALFVNTSRAELIQAGALVAALKSGRPGYAAVDVYEQEPIAPNHPLLAMENVLCTPHLGYAERDTFEQFFGSAIEQIEAFCQGKPINVLNPG